MPIVLLRLPVIGTTNDDRPRQCLYCGSAVLQSWGQVSRKVQDTQPRRAELGRYRCGECGRTFRYYPKGVDRSAQSDRIRSLAALTWALGMSTREVVNVFQKLGVPLSRMSVWRDGQELLNRMIASKDHEYLRRYTIDRHYIKNVSKKLGVILAVDLGMGKSAILGTLDEFSPKAVKTWLEPMVGDIDIEISLVKTDTLDYLNVIDPLPVRNSQFG